MDFRYVNEIANEIDFTFSGLDITKKAKHQNYKCYIALTGSDISKIKINYELFQLWFPHGTTGEEKISTYEKLLKKFSDDGFLESHKMLDIEYRDFKNKHDGDYFLNGFMKYWWNYGYNKEWVIYWSLGLLLFFTVLNILPYKYLREHVYKIEFEFYRESAFNRLNSATKWIWFPKSFAMKTWNYTAMFLLNPLIYTSIIFFGIKIDLERFQKFSILTMYIWLIYVLGLFCLAYIFNIIIVK